MGKDREGRVGKHEGKWGGKKEEIGRREGEKEWRKKGRRRKEERGLM